MQDETNMKWEYRQGLALDAYGTFRMGDVSYCMLLEALKGLELIHAPENCPRTFSRYVPLLGDKDTSDEEYRNDTLFLCHIDMAKELLDSSSARFCVIITRNEDVPEWIMEKSYCNRTIVIKQIERFFYYDSLLKNLFFNDILWENEMDRVVYNKGRLDRIIAISENILGNFICITDTGYNLIAFSHCIEPPDEGGYRYLLENNCYDKNEIQFIEKHVLSLAKEKSQLIVCEPDKNRPYWTLHYPVFIDNAYLFHVVMVSTSESVEYLTDIFLKFMRRIISICKDFWKTTVNLESPWHRVLIGLIDGEHMTEDYIDAQLKQTNILASKQFRLLYFQFDSQMSFQTRSRIVETAKSLNGGLCYPFMHRDNLLVLYYSTATNDAVLSGNKVFNEVDQFIFKSFGIAAGVSQVFYSIRDIGYAFQQAFTAYAMRACMKKEFESLYGNPSLPCYAFEHILKYYLLTEGHDTGLVEFSFEHSILQRLLEEDKIAGTNIVQLVWIYLNNGQNATETSKIAHVHRNTVLYHISKLEKRFDISFDSPLLRSRMMLDCYRLFIDSCV